MSKILGLQVAGAAFQPTSPNPRAVFFTDAKVVRKLILLLTLRYLYGFIVLQGVCLIQGVAVLN